MILNKVSSLIQPFKLDIIKFNRLMVLQEFIITKVQQVMELVYFIPIKVIIVILYNHSITIYTFFLSNLIRCPLIKLFDHMPQFDVLMFSAFILSLLQIYLYIYSLSLFT